MEKVVPNEFRLFGKCCLDVQSRGVVHWIESDSIWLVCPCFPVSTAYQTLA